MLLSVLLAALASPPAALPVTPGSDAGVALTLLTAVGAFCGTNLDDILLLLLCFSQLDGRRGALGVVAGQYLGLGLLVLVSLGGLLGRVFVPSAWLGLLGLLPISLAVSRWLEPGDPAPREPAPAPLGLAGGAGAPMAGALAVAALTVANGSDNIGVYLPLFARASPAQLLLILAVFAAMAGLWCALAWGLARAPGLGSLLRRHGDRLMPALLVGLGLYLLIDAGVFEHRGLAVLALTALAAMAVSLSRPPPPRPGLSSPSPRLPSP